MNKEKLLLGFILTKCQEAKNAIEYAIENVTNIELNY